MMPMMSGRRLAVTVAALVATAGLSLLDLAPTVGMKSLVVRTLPFSDTTKAATIKGLCDRALTSSIGAALACYRANAPERLVDLYFAQ